MIEDSWWAVARSEEVTAVKPVNVDLGDQPLVLWRDNGVVRVLEDRCPHRRAPLSLGCVLKSGAIQCGYHGWTYDGANGRLIDIPNLKGEQKYPPVYRAKNFAVVEAGGFVRVCLNNKAEAPVAVPPEPLPLAGSTTVALGHEHFIAALFDDPALVIAIRGVHFTPYLMAELAEQDERLVLERSCQWQTPHWPAPFSPEFPITLRVATDPLTGESDLLLRDDAFNPLLAVTLAPVPGSRGVTQVRWRARLGPRRPGVLARLLGVRAPFRVLPATDGEALRRLKPSASIHAADLRAAIAGAQPHPAPAATTAA